MAELSRTEFCKFYGVKQNYISTNVSRNRLVLMADGKKIDTNDPTNAACIAKLLSERDKKGGVVPAVSQQNTDESVIIPPEKQSAKVKKAAEKTQISLFDLQLKKTEADYEKKVIDTKLAELKLQKDQGNSIPIDLVMQIVSDLSKSFLNAYKSYSEQLINEIAHKFSIENTERSKLVSRLTDQVNAIHLKAVNDSRGRIKNAIGTVQDQLDLDES